MAANEPRIFWCVLKANIRSSKSAPAQDFVSHEEKCTFLNASASDTGRKGEEESCIVVFFINRDTFRTELNPS